MIPGSAAAGNSDTIDYDGDGSGDGDDDDGDVSDTLRHRDEARDEGHLEWTSQNGALLLGAGGQVTIHTIQCCSTLLLYQRASLFP